jgi:hypothetical protein
LQLTTVPSRRGYSVPEREGRKAFRKHDIWLGRVI